MFIANAEDVAILQEWRQEARLASVFLPRDSINYFADQNPLADAEYGKVAVFGLPKSGNTWLHGLLCDTLDLPYLLYPEEVRTRGVFSTHLPFNDDIKYRHDFVHSVCIIRDIRDIITSYFHYMQTESYQKLVPLAAYHDIETFYYDWFLSRIVPALRFETYWSEYAEHGVPILRYERLRLDAAGELRRLFRRWAEPVNEDRLASAVDANSFENLRTKGKNLGDVYMPPTHFRRGQASTYLEELPPQILADVNKRFGEVLRRWGYPI